MRRLAIFWLACAAVGFLAAVGAAVVLCLALDGAATWRASQPRVVDRDGDAPAAAPATAPNDAAGNTAGQPQSLLASLLGAAA